MKIEELLENRKHPSYYNFDEVMDIYSRMEMFYRNDMDSAESDADYEEFENLKRTYELTDPEIRREVELTQGSSEPDMGRADRY